jgi:putative membrane protein
MERKRSSFLLRWMVTTVGVLVAANIVDGIRYESIVGLVVASLLLGIFNSILRPIMFLLSLPLMILTLGLFTFVINGLMLYLVGQIVKSFHVAGFWPAFKGALVISIVSFLANGLIGRGESKPSGPRPPTPPGPEDRGPVIDV